MEWSRVLFTFLWSISTSTLASDISFEFVPAAISQSNKMAALVRAKGPEERPVHKVPRLHQGQLIKVAL